MGKRPIKNFAIKNAFVILLIGAPDTMRGTNKVSINSLLLKKL